LLKGKLPWQGISTKDLDAKYEQILQHKKSPLKLLCQDLPPIISRYMHYCRTLEFTDKPDYKGLKEQFTESFNETLTSEEFLFDWQLKTRSKEWEYKRINSTNAVPIDNEEKKAPALSTFKVLSSNILHLSFPDIKKSKMIKEKLEVPCASVGPSISNNNETNVAVMNFREGEDNKNELPESKGKIIY